MDRKCYPKPLLPSVRVRVTHLADQGGKPTTKDDLQIARHPQALIQTVDGRWVGGAINSSCLI